MLEIEWTLGTERGMERDRSGEKKRSLYGQKDGNKGRETEGVSATLRHVLHSKPVSFAFFYFFFSDLCVWRGVGRGRPGQILIGRLATNFSV